MSEEEPTSPGAVGRQPAPSGPGEAGRTEPGRVRRGWRASGVVCALDMVAGLAGTAAVRALAGPGGSAASAIPSPPAANAAFAEDDNGTAVIGGRRLPGLLKSTTRVLAGEETGGPLVNLSGQVIGVDLGGAGSGVRSTGYAVPINEAPAAARQMQASGGAT